MKRYVTQARRLYAGTLKSSAVVACMLYMTIGLSQSPIIGRWDITFEMNGRERPGWLEVRKSGNSTLVGTIVVITGSARPVSEIVEKNGRYSFTIPVQWENGGPLSFEAMMNGDMLKGTMHYSDGKTYNWTAVRAPKLKRDQEPVWGDPVQLFNGKDLSGWTTQKPGEENQWIAEDGILKNPRSGANLKTEDLFDDFKLHIEFRYPEGSNSGVYLRGRYEVQIEDNAGMDPSPTLLGGIYGFIAASEMVAKAPGEWQIYDITLIGRMVTVVANGVEIICNQEIPGTTGGALDSNEGEPGPILLQGDHGPVEFRNISVRVRE